MENEDVIDIRLIGRTDIQSIVALLNRRNPLLPLDLLSERVAEMASQGFQCFGAYQDGRLVGIAGFWIKTRYHTGRVIESDGVFVEMSHRSRGIGERMAMSILAYGKQHGCLEGELHCYLPNAEAHRFWLNRGYRIIAFHFGRTL